MTGHLVLASSIHIGGWKWAGNFTTLDLIAAGTNALNGALLARRPDHYKNFTVVGIISDGAADGPGRGDHPRRAGEPGSRRPDQPGLYHLSP